MRGEISRAVIIGLTRLSQRNPLNSHFIEYIPDPEAFSNNAFLQFIAEDIVKIATGMKILRSRGGEWITPEEAVILPPEFILGGEPLFTEQELNLSNTVTTSRKRYLSPGDYTSPRSQKILEVLKIQQFSDVSVQNILLCSGFSFHEKPDSWFPLFFEYLCRLRYKSRLTSPIFGLPFLRLENDVWVAKSSSVFSPATPAISVPQWLALQILDRNYWEAVSRNQMATEFLNFAPAVQRLTTNIPISTLIDLHANMESRGVPFPHSTLVQHAEYLSNQQTIPFEYRDRLQSTFHLTDTDERCTLARQLCRDRTINWPWGEYRLSTINSEAIHFLHQDYISGAIPTFIDTYLRLPKFPPLLEFSTGRVSTFYTWDLAPALQRDNKLLYLLCEEEVWGGLQGRPLTLARNTLKDIYVWCNGALIPLKDCYLLTEELEPLISPEMNILEVEEPNHQKWSFLLHLGVTSRPNAQLYLNKLKRVQNNSMPPEQLVKEVYELYEGLERCSGSSDTPTIQYFSFVDRDLHFSSTFNRENLLLLKFGATYRWVKPMDVRRGVPAFVEFTTRYAPEKQIWSQTTHNFVRRLNIPAWSNSADLQVELERFSLAFRENSLCLGDWRATCKYIFRALKITQSELPTNGSRVPVWIQYILGLSCFPTVQPGNGQRICSLSPEVYVLNSPFLNSHFEGRICTLDFGGESVYALLDILKVKLPPENFLSFHDRKKEMEPIESLGNITWLRNGTEEYITRYQLLNRSLLTHSMILSQRPQFLDLRSQVIAKWSVLEVDLCQHLYQRIHLQTMQTPVFVDRSYHILSTSEKTTIYLSKSSQHPIEFGLGQALEQYWELRNVAERIYLILSQSNTRAVEGMLGVWNYPELPKAWSISEDSVQVDERPEHPMTQQSGQSNIVFSFEIKL